MAEFYDSWGRLDHHPREASDSATFAAAGAAGGAFLPFGNGRSYGDSCHNDDGRLVPMQPGARIHAFDPQTGILDADAGVTLEAILARVVPHGFFLEVTPGTALATLGGAVANDVHGKNHHRRGSFGHAVVSFDLLRSDRGALLCSRSENADLFAASVGGMGLTGLITRVRLRLMRVGSADIEQLARRFSDIDGYFDAIDAIDREHEYSVAWIDQLATGKSTGRGVLLAGNHAEAGTSVRAARKHLSVPLQPPVNLLNRLTLTAFNALYFARAPKRETRSLAGWRGYFHPLDAIGHWNRLYGPKGLYQHQSVFPVEGARETVLRLMECARRQGHSSFLTVLKRFGDVSQTGLLSFARPGFTLTLDFANQGAGTLRMLDALDQIVLEAGGALNPYKDARMSPAMFAASFPHWRRLEAMRDPRLVSDFWKRTALALPADNGGEIVRFGGNDNARTSQSGTADNLKQIRQPT
jgi:FAD/FMN-containing dehydrogenase